MSFKKALIPGFPDGASKIGKYLSVLNQDGIATYFVGSEVLWTHKVCDQQHMRFILVKLMDLCHVRPRDLEGAPLLIKHRTLMNWLSQLGEHGAAIQSIP